MEKVRDSFDYYRNDVDDVLYYNPDELNRMLDEEELEEARKKAREEGLKQGREEGRKEGREEGREEGRKEGIKERTLDIAKNMKKSNISLEQIADITKLSIEQLKKL